MLPFYEVNISQSAQYPKQANGMALIVAATRYNLFTLNASEMQEEIDFRDDYIIIGNILAKYPLATEEEQRVLEDWKQKNGNRQIFDAIIEARETDLQIILTIFEGMEASREKYLARLLERTQSKLNWWNNWKMYAAAASIAIALITTTIWLSNRKNKEVASTEAKPLPVVNDAAPGKYAARLTLADGRVIVLDSAREGALATQGSTVILNKGNQLVYDPSKAPAAGEGDVKEGFNTLSTAKGQTYTTVLSDGSKVWLNSASSIRYPVVFTGKERKVEITGEAYFEIATVEVSGPNNTRKKMPFIVTVNGIEVEVLGTHFNINSYSNEEDIKTTLLEGKVKVSSLREDGPSLLGGIPRSSGQATQSLSSIMLKPGEQAILRRGQDGGLAVVKDVDVNAEVAWRFGYFNFNNADLKTMMRQLERWYDVQVVYQGGEVSDFEFLGKIPRELRLSQVLNVLENQKVHFKMVGSKIIVTP